MHENVKEFKDLCEKLINIHTIFYSYLSQITGQIKSRQFELSDLADLGFLCREAENLLDDWRKDIKARKELIGKLIALTLLQDPTNINSDNPVDSVQGELATAISNLIMMADLPKKGTPDYYSVLDYFNLPSDPLLKLDWKRTQEEITKLMNEGVSLPLGLGKTYPQYSSTFRRRSKNGQD